MRAYEIKNELNDIDKLESKINWKDLRYETKSSVYDFQQYDTIRSFCDKIYTRKISMDEAEMDQINLLKNCKEFSEKSKPRTKKYRDRKNILLKV